MNIFILDKDIDKCAEAYVTKHIGKMQLESAQILCTVLHTNQDIRNKLGVTYIPYKKSHVNHPCTLWASKSITNYKYVGGLMFAISKEYARRYNRTHLSYTKMIDYGIITPEMYESAKSFDILRLDAPACMPDEFKKDNVIESYRKYYCNGKVHLHQWTNATPPVWIK